MVSHTHTNPGVWLWPVLESVWGSKEKLPAPFAWEAPAIGLGMVGWPTRRDWGPRIYTGISGESEGQLVWKPLRKTLSLRSWIESRFLEKTFGHSIAQTLSPTLGMGSDSNCKESGIITGDGIEALNGPSQQPTSTSHTPHTPLFLLYHPTPPTFSPVYSPLPTFPPALPPSCLPTPTFLRPHRAWPCPLPSRHPSHNNNQHVWRT